MFLGLALETNGCFLAPRFNVYVFSNLPLGTPLLRVHCASKNDDLGYHTLASNENFTWNFCEGLFKNTLYFCHLWWGDKQKQFDSFKSNWHFFRHDTFSWFARTDGIYSNSEGSDDVIKRYDWEVNH